MNTVFQIIGSLGDGGAETLVKDYALLLDKSKFKVIVITIYPPTSETANVKILRESNIPIVSLYKKHSLANRILRRYTMKLLDSFKLNKLVSQYKPSVIHVHQAYLYALKPIRKKLRHIKLMYTCHSLPVNFLGPNISKENNAAKCLIRDNNLQMIALHNDMKQEIDTMFGINNTIVINNGIDFKKYNKLTFEQERFLRKEINLSKEDFVVGHIGRFSKAKNHTFLIEVFNEILKRKPNSKLLLIGAGPLENEIKCQINQLNIKENVRLLNHRTDVNQLLRLMNVFLFPSLYEGFGIVLVEAQVSDLRCVVSDKVNPIAIASPNTISVSLTKSASEWADIVLNDKITNSRYTNLNVFNLRKIIKIVERIYQDESFNPV